MSRRPIDIMREEGFSAKIGNDDEGELKDNIVIGSKLYLIKERAIYAFNLADDIDPDRTNSQVPNISQKAYDVGVNSEIVGRVLLQAKYLFEKGPIGSGFDRNEILSVVISVFDELCSLLKIMQALQQDQQMALDGVKTSGEQIRFFAVPSVMDAAGRAKNFIQRAEHSVQHLFRLCKICLGLPNEKNGWFDGVRRRLECHSDLQRYDAGRVAEIVSYCKFIRNCRHTVEHARQEQCIYVKDFFLDKKGSLNLPSIEVVHSDTPEPPIPLIDFMIGNIESLISVSEELMAILAFCIRDSGWKDKIGVASMPVEKRRSPDVKFYFVINAGGDLHPIG